VDLEQFENPYIKRIRSLTGVLVVSVGLNTAFVASAVYLHFSKKQLADWEHKPQIYERSMTNAKVLSAYFDFSFNELCSELGNKTLLQDGYTMRDLALACLVNYHHFDLTRAVSGVALQHRKMAFIHQNGGEFFELEVFPGLSDREFQMVHGFVQRTKWPLTSEGLFLELQKTKGSVDASLIEAFQATPEFYALFTAFNRADEKISYQELLKILVEGSWEGVRSFVAERGNSPDRLTEHLRAYLQDSLSSGSKRAASYWVSLEADVILRILDDPTLVKLISLLDESKPPFVRFLRMAQTSPRSDLVRDTAFAKLIFFGCTSVEALPTEPPKPQIVEKQESVKERCYVVQSGDNLWKIAHKHGVTIDQIKRDNKLKNEQLRPGQELLIRNQLP
jgi:hypothetical protein